MPELTLATLGVLLCVSLIAGCVDAIAGGGGLLTIPALLWAGLPPAQALGTNKLQSTAGSLSASIHFIRVGSVDFKRFWPAFVAALIGGALGTGLVLLIQGDWLRPAIPWLLVAIAIYLVLARRAGDVERKRRLSVPLFSCTLALLIGAYDGFFGPGTGTFFAIACVSTLGMTLPSATAHSKVLNFASNIASLTAFIFAGSVLWVPGLVMALGQFCGAQLGARLVVRSGAQVIRIVLVVVTAAMAIKLFVWP